MTGRTHDLAAFTALNYCLAISTLPHISLATTLVAFTANMIGGLTPDIDQPTGDLWHKLPGGTLYARLFTPFLGGHRHISHSVIGIGLFGFLAYGFLHLASKSLIVDIPIVWWSFMIGYVSHLVMDTLTREGVCWFFPIPFAIGIPPFAFLRVKTGGFVEKYIVFPGLLVLNGYIFYASYGKYLTFFHHFIK
jgi:inner membrane protein